MTEEKTSNVNDKIAGSVDENVLDTENSSGNLSDELNEILIEDENTPSADETISELEAKVNEWQDKYIRISAEFDNYRKRTLKEKSDLLKYGSEDALKSLIPVIDDFERGLKSIDQAQDMNSVKEGMLLIYNKFREYLNQRSIKEIEALNLDFNVDVHEAITKIPVEDKSLSGKIVDVVEKGYYLHDKVIRFSKVVIAE